ncbi:single-stranded DNA-binding protein [Actinopolymorpha sp. B17G11]|uniref:single-stranded DNA-binding protein n=1 Tax=Actinopolymorpha sp. B17G11 TaxID=3160861 RepID=UPI0032E48A8D
MNAPNPHRPRRLPSQGHHTAEEPAGVPTNGSAVVSFTVAVNSRNYDRQTGQWTDGDTSFVRCTAWRQLAENVTECLQKGDRVVVAGRFTEDHWQDAKTGENRSAWKLTADAVGVELSFATATPKRVRRAPATAPDDPWANGTRTRPEPVGAGPEPADEPPF